jgi:hypothetical protein
MSKTSKLLGISAIKTTNATRPRTVDVNQRRLVTKERHATAVSGYSSQAVRVVARAASTFPRDTLMGTPEVGK